MPVNHPIHRLHPIESGAAWPQAQGCGDCRHSISGPVCQATHLPLGEPALLDGPDEVLQPLLAELARSLGDEAAPQANGLQWVRALRWQAGEVELTLGVGPHCAGADLADRAFQSLKRLLPDTDVYVLHA